MKRLDDFPNNGKPSGKSSGENDSPTSSPSLKERGSREVVSDGRFSTRKIVANIDTDSLLATVNLQVIISADLGSPDGAGNWSCPWHEDKTPSLGIVVKTPRCWHCFSCGRSGDAITWMRERRGLDFRAACEALGNGHDLPALQGSTSQRERPRLRQATKPATSWSEAAERVCATAERTLWAEDAKPAREYLHGRGFTDETIGQWRLGWNPTDQYFAPEQWGLPADHKRIYLPAGIVIPWRIDGTVWRVNVRRSNADPKYIGPAGFKNALFNADALTPDIPAVLVEGEFDCMTVAEHAGNVVVPVATGSASSSRLAKWVYRLSACPSVLLAFDRDEAGDGASAWWAEQLPNARRWAPLGKDPGDMREKVRPWICAALGVTDTVVNRREAGPILPFPERWIEQFNVEQLERLAIRTVDGTMSDAEALSAEALEA